MVSIIVAVYNVQKYLEGCIDSLRSQTCSDIEIILVDDGSKDQSGAICDRAQQQDSRIQVIHKPNGGLSSARNAALPRIKGEYVMFVDGDDRLEPNCVEVLLDLLKKHDAQIAVCNELRFCYREDGSMQILSDQYQKIEGEKEYTAQEALENILYQRDFDASACGKLYRRELFEGVEYPLGRIFEDIGTTYRLVSKCSKVVFTGQKLYCYLQRQDSLAHSVSLKHVLDGVDMVEQQERDLLRNFPQLAKACRCRCLSMYFHGLLSGEQPQQVQKELWEKICSNRAAVLSDRKARKKTRIAAALSYLGRKPLKKIYQLKSQD